MEEEKFVEEQIENIDITEAEEIVVPVVDESIILATQDDIVATNIKEEEVFNVTISEDVGPHALKIVSDHSFGLPMQHSIDAIEDLREELDEIERLKTVYSDSLNHANYYAWTYGGPPSNSVNGIGYFVSINPENNFIKLCASDEDAVGVTVNAAGFVGGQDANTPRDDKYVLVVHSGIVAVRCELDPTDSAKPCVEAGDYVTSDDYGVAKKTDGTYGYRVSAISRIDGVWHAIISLTMPTTQMQKFSEIVQDVDDRMDSAEINIATAISVANAAYNKAQVAQNWVQGNVENIAGDVVIIGGKVDNVVTDINGLKDSVANSTVQSDKAYDIATKAQQYASDTKVQVEAELNDAYTTINNLTDAVAPITTWVGYDESGAEVQGASYFVQHVQHIDKNFLETKTQIETVQTLTEENQTAISQNAENIQLLATSIDEYSVGEWSQAYGLTLSQAWSILNPGMIYIPTPVTHYEKYVYEIVDIWDEQGKDTSMIYKEKDTGLYWRSIIQKDENDNLTNQWESIDLTTTDDIVFIIDDTQAFTRGYYYTWNGFYWVESESPYVYFSAAYAHPSKKCQYWYRDTDEDLIHEGVTYKAHGLYMIINDKWTEVNILDGNITNRVASMINQTANSISLDVSNARGDIADLKLEVGAQGSQIAMVVSNSGTSDIELAGTVESIDSLPANAQDGIYYAVKQKVYRYNGTEWKEQYHLTYDGIYVKKISAANIIAAVNNDGESMAAINADRINFNGYATFTDDGSGITGISGNLIHTGIIVGNNTDLNQRISIDLDNGVITGNVDVTGKITATSGYIGDADNGFTIEAQNNRLICKVPESGLTEGDYYFQHSNKYYSFKLNENVSKEDKITIHSNMSYYKINKTYGDSVSVVDSPKGTKLEVKEDTYYCLYQNQLSIKGNDEGTPGIFISPEGIGLGNGNFYVDDHGDVTMKGNIVLGGSITWEASSNPLKVLYREDYTEDAPTPSDYKTAEETNTTWHTKLQTTDYYASYSYDGGVNWTLPIKIQSKDGEQGPPGQNGTTLSNVDIFNMLTAGGKTQGLFPFYGTLEDDVDTPQLYINAEYIKAGILSGVTVESENTTNDKIQLNDSHIHFIEGKSNNTKLDIGFYDFGMETHFPYMVFGAGTDSSDGSANPIDVNTGYLYKAEVAGTNLFMIGLDVDTSGKWINELEITFRSNDYERCIDFGNSSVTFGTKKALMDNIEEDMYINFGESHVDFSQCESVTFGDQIPTAYAVFG